MKDTRFLYQIRAEAEKDEAEILIYDEIGKGWFGDGVGAEDFVKDLAKLTAKNLTVRINSAGGQVFEGLAIYQALRRYDGKVVTEIDSLAASIASIIALAGSEVRMADSAFLMVHNPHGVAFGNANDMLEMAALLEKVGGSLAAVYAEATGASEKKVQEWMDAETWFTAEEAKAAGFIDAITKGKKIEARADVGGFRNTPARLRALLAELEPPPEEEEEDEEKKPDAAAGDADPEKKPPPESPASKAKEKTMSDKDTAAQTIAAERDRAKSIRAIGETHKMDAAKVNQWVDEGKTVDEVNALVLAEIKAKAAGAPPIRSAGARAEGVRNRAEDDPRAGFDAHRDFLVAVMKDSNAGTREQVRDERLRPLAVTDENRGPRDGMSFVMPRGFAPKSIRAAAGSDEQGTYSDTYGGFAVPTEVKPGLLSIGFDGDPTAGLVTSVPMAAPIVKFNARTDKNHTTSVSGGLTFTRTPETVAASASRMAIEQVTLEAAPLVGLAYETEQLITDSPISFAALLSAGFADQRAAHILNEKLHGVGGGQYTGVVSASCTISVAKETSQVAATINSENVIKMAARLWGSGVWLANPDTRPQLYKLSLAIGTAGVPLYQPSPNAGFPDRLLGWPIAYTEMCKTVGTVGDLILGNWSQYLEGIYQPMRSDESIHVRFVELERAFRFYERNCGAPWWRSALTPKNGATLSPFVTLATRA